MPTFHTKPPLGVAVNWGHYFARDLAQRFLFNGRSARPVGLINGVIANPQSDEARTVASHHDNGSMLFGVSGSDGYLNAGTDRSTQDLALAPMTIIARIRLPTSGAIGGIAERSDGNTVNQGWTLGVSGLEIGCKFVRSSIDLKMVAGSALRAGVWQWVAVTINGNDTVATLGNAIYVEGVSKTLTSSSGAVGTKASDATRSLLIGYNSFEYNTSTGSNVPFNGHISDLAFYRRCFSAADVQAYINAPYAMLGQPQRRHWWFGAAAPASTGAVSISAPSVAGSGTETIAGGGSVSIGAPSVQGSSTITGSGGVAIGYPSVDGVGDVVDDLGSRVEISRPSVSASGTETIAGDGAVTIGMGTVSGAGSAPAVTPLWTKNRLYTAPSAANGISVTPSSTAWGWSNWAELDPSTSTGWLLSSLVVVPDVLGPASVTAEFEVGIGAAGSETSVDRFRAHWFTAYYSSPGELPRSVLLDAIPALRRVAIRMRKNNGSTTPWRVSATYFRKPIVGTVLASAQPQKTLPDGANNVSLTISSSNWANPAWTEVAASTGTDWLLVDLLPAAGGLPSDWELDVGVGATPVVVTTVRFYHTGIHPVDGPTLIPLFVPLSAFPAGSRVSLRARHGSNIGGGSIAASLVYMELPL